MPKRLALILIYMAFIFCCIIGLAHYAQHHPLDEKTLHEQPQKH